MRGAWWVSAFAVFAALSTCTATNTSLIDCQVDLVFVLDSSTSLTGSHWQMVKEFARDIVDQLPIGLDNVRVGVVCYATDATVEFVLDTHITAAAVKNAIMPLPQKHGTTATGSAIRQARINIFSQPADRPDVPDVIIVLTDGNFNVGLSLIDQVNAAKVDGIILFAVGVGNVDAAEIDLISSDPNFKYSYYLANFNALTGIISTITEDICIMTPCDDVERLLNPEAIIDIYVNQSLSCSYAKLVGKCCALTTVLCVPYGTEPGDVFMLQAGGGGLARYATDVDLVEGSDFLVLIKFEGCKGGPCDQQGFVGKYGNTLSRWPRLNPCFDPNEGCLCLAGGNKEVLETLCEGLTATQECWTTSDNTCDNSMLGAPILFVLVEGVNVFIFGFVRECRNIGAGFVMIVEKVEPFTATIGCTTKCIPGCWLSDPSLFDNDEPVTEGCQVESWRAGINRCGIHPPLCQIVVPEASGAVPIGNCGFECCYWDQGCDIDFSLKVKCPFP